MPFPVEKEHIEERVCHPCRGESAFLSSGGIAALTPRLLSVNSGFNALFQLDLVLYRLTQIEAERGRDASVKNPRQSADVCFLNL